MLQNLPHHQRIEAIVEQTRLRQVAVNKTHAGADLFRLPREEVPGKGKRLGVNIHTGDVEALAGQENFQDTFAASHVQDSRAPRLIHHPIDSLTKDLARITPLNNSKIDLRNSISVRTLWVYFCLVYHAFLSTIEF